MIVVDASAVIELLTRSERGLRVESRILGDGGAMHAPALIDLEVAQVMRRYVASGQVPERWARAALDLTARLPIMRYLHEPLMKRVWDLRDNATAYDAAYLALAEALRAPLVTCDAKLSRVPLSTAVVEVVA